MGMVVCDSQGLGPELNRGESANFELSLFRHNSLESFAIPALFESFHSGQTALKRQ